MLNVAKEVAALERHRDLVAADALRLAGRQETRRRRELAAAGLEVDDGHARRHRPVEERLQRRGP